MRELSVQAANGTNVNTDRDAIQNEVAQLVSEVDRIANTTEFNGISFLNGSGPGKKISQTTIDSLTNSIPSYLDDAIDMIEPVYNMSIGGPRDLDITYYYDDTTSTGASMGTADGGATLEMRINLANVTDANRNIIAEDSLDGLIAHEVMHAYQFINMLELIDADDRGEEMWFMEGLAMLVQGGNYFGGADGNVAIAYPFDGGYRDAYNAVKVLHEVTNGGINAVIDELVGGSDLDTAIATSFQNFTGTELEGAAGGGNFTGTTDFINWYNANSGAGTLNTYLTTSNDFTVGAGILTDADTKGSSAVTTNAVTNDAATTSSDAAFNITFTNPNFAGTGGNLIMQIGANEDQDIFIQLGNVT